MEENKNQNTPNNSGAGNPGNNQGTPGKAGGPAGNPKKPAAGASKNPGARKKQPEKKEKKEKKGSNAAVIILIVVVILLLGGVGFLVYKDNQNTTKIAQQDTKIEEDSVMIAGLESEIIMKEEEVNDLIDQLGTSNDSLNVLAASLIDLRKELEDETKRRKTYQAYYSKYLKLSKSIKGWEEKVAAITHERDSIAALKDTLENKALVMNDTISNLREVKTSLEEKVALASKLEVNQFLIRGINDKGKTFNKDSYKSKHLDQLKVTFNLRPNAVAKKGEKTVHMRLIEPDGTVLFETSTGGGTFETAEGEEKFYTLSQEIQYDNTQQPITFFYRKGGDYKSGEHTIEMWSEGHQIGVSTFEVNDGGFLF